ncbi:glycosyltransferase family 2 protein [Sneathiella litorea]|uniref:Glycosyltransferase n=1 Tax=Sneathiella litorea TaxID=2606216 RepID=A0A6L8W7C2_9PROT|nr:glycosyltransferase family A protein [Sneathiella litorea]MZR30394.1 glycosyltransferase [Sneathiella litorea]
MKLDVTIGISIRETFSRTIPSLKSILANTPENLPIIFISSGLPADILKEVEKLSKRHPIQVIHADCYLSPNQARNLIIQEAKTKYIAFVDNDVEVDKNWLEPLVRCAEDEGADIVSPLIFERFPLWKYIHIAGGEAEIKEPGNGVRVCHELHRFSKQDIAKLPENLDRGPTELFEFHVVLINRDFLLKTGMLDEKLLSVSEHWDVCIQAQEMGSKIFFEPASRVSYIPPFKPTEEDIRLFNLRWCDDWVNGSIRRLEEKHNLTPDQGNLKAVKGFVKAHRLHKYVRTRQFLATIFGAKVASVFINRIVMRIDPVLVNYAIRKDLAKWQDYTLAHERSRDFTNLPDERATHTPTAHTGHTTEPAGKAQ